MQARRSFWPRQSVICARCGATTGAATARRKGTKRTTVDQDRSAYLHDGVGNRDGGGGRTGDETATTATLVAVGRIATTSTVRQLRCGRGAPTGARTTAWQRRVEDGEVRGCKDDGGDEDWW